MNQSHGRSGKAWQGLVPGSFGWRVQVEDDKETNKCVPSICLERCPQPVPSHESGTGGLPGDLGAW